MRRVAATQGSRAARDRHHGDERQADPPRLRERHESVANGVPGRHACRRRRPHHHSSRRTPCSPACRMRSRDGQIRGPLLTPEILTPSVVPVPEDPWDPGRQANEHARPRHRGETITKSVHPVPRHWTDLPTLDDAGTRDLGRPSRFQHPRTFPSGKDACSNLARQAVTNWHGPERQRRTSVQHNRSPRWVFLAAVAMFSQ